MLWDRTILLTVIYEALLIGFWFIDHAYAVPIPHLPSPNCHTQVSIKMVLPLRRRHEHVIRHLWVSLAHIVSQILIDRGWLQGT
jgi:hypothetical protein